MHVHTCTSHCLVAATVMAALIKSSPEHLNAHTYMQVPLIGHSQGGTIALAALSELPRMNAAISLLIGLAPVVGLGFTNAGFHPLWVGLL